jgi:hypothetical protein
MKTLGELIFVLSFFLLLFLGIMKLAVFFRDFLRKIIDNLNALFPKNILPYESRKYLLTDTEKHFYVALNSALISYDPSLRILSKVRLADIIKPKNGIEHWQHFFNKISAKHIDFVICSAEFNILFCIELDDSSHSKPNRKERDSFVDSALKSSEIPIIHIPTAYKYDSFTIIENLNIAVRAGQGA